MFTRSFRSIKSQLQQNTEPTVIRLFDSICSFEMSLIGISDRISDIFNRNENQIPIVKIVHLFLSCSSFSVHNFYVHEHFLMFINKCISSVCCNNYFNLRNLLTVRRANSSLRNFSSCHRTYGNFDNFFC